MGPHGDRVVKRLMTGLPLILAMEPETLKRCRAEDEPPRKQRRTQADDAHGDFSDTERMFALCMSQHSRLGSASPARYLQPVLLQRVYRHLDQLAGLTLSVSSMPIPRRDLVDGTALVSCMRRFTVEVALTGEGHPQGATSLNLQALVVCEDGTPVSLGERASGTPADELLWGANATIGGSSGNKATFRLQLGPGMAQVQKLEQVAAGSTEWRPRLFRVRIGPRDGALAASHAQLVATSEPFRVVSMVPARPAALPPIVAHTSLLPVAAAA